MTKGDVARCPMRHWRLGHALVLDDRALVIEPRTPRPLRNYFLNRYPTPRTVSM